MDILTKDIFDKIQQVERRAISFETLCEAIWAIEFRVPKEELLSINERCYAWALAHRADQPDALALAEITFGMYHFYTSSYEKAMEFHREALDRFRSLQDQAGVGLAMINLGAVYRSLGDLDLSLEFSVDGLKLLKETDHHHKFACYGAYGIAELYMGMKQYEASIPYYEEALAIGKPRKFSTGVIRSLSGLGNAYLKLNEFDKALAFLEDAIAQNQDEGSVALESRLFNDLGDFYFDTQNYEQSLHYYQKSFTLREEHQLEDASITSQLGIAKALRQQGDIEKALEVAHNALAKATKLGVKAKQFAIHLILSNLYEEEGDTTQALQHFRLYHDLKEEVIDDNSRKKVEQMQTMHNAILKKKGQESDHYKSLSRQLQHQNKYIEKQNKELSEKEKSIETLYAQEHEVLQGLQAAMEEMEETLKSIETQRQQLDVEDPSATIDQITTNINIAMDRMKQIVNTLK